MADEDAKRRAEDEAARRRTLAAAGIGLGVGIGSAALAAALLYSRNTRNKEDGDVPPRLAKAPKTPIQGGNRWTD